MDWDKLRIFHAVAESGSLTGAGKNLGLSQSAVSRHITTLEEALGVALFRRHARGLMLTEQGLILQDAAKDMSVKLSLMKGRLADMQALPEGPLIVTVSEFISSTWLAPRLGEFRERFPKIALTVIVDDRVLNINMREADAAIRLHRPKGPGLIQRQLATIGFHICGAKSYIEKHGKPKSAAELKNHFLIGFPDNMTNAFMHPGWLFETAGVDTKDSASILKMNSMYAIFAAVREGAGLAVLPDYVINATPELETVLPNLCRPDVDMFFIYAEERKNSKRINALRDFILENVEKTKF